MDMEIPKMSHPVRNIFRVPEEVRQDFWKESVRKNDLSMVIICVIIFVVELYNIARVLFVSSSRLSTWNNRIYFGMYCLLIGLGVLWIIFHRLFREAPASFQWAIQYVLTSLMLLWHMLLNAYDLYRDPGAGTTVLTTALLGLALLIQAPPQYSIAQCVVGYLVFWVVMAPRLDGGDRLNLTISFLVALAVSLAHARHTCLALEQQAQILRMNAKLQDLVQLDSLTGLLNKTTMEYRIEQLLHGPASGNEPGGLTLFLLDLDGFKGINDQYGHPCGDQVLIETARSMEKAFPNAAGLGRIGGDEFAVLYDYPMTEEQASSLGEALGKGLKNIRWQEQPVAVSCSVGACSCTLPQQSYQQLYAETDRMLYQAKKSGRGRCCVLRLEAEEPLAAKAETT